MTMHQLLYFSQDLLSQVPHHDENGKAQLSEFDRLLRSKWDAAVEMGCFRYRLEELQTKILPGPMKLVAQLNIKRATDRRKPQIMNHVNQPFNPNLFNFTKVDSKEVLFELCPKRDTANCIPDHSNLSSGSSDQHHSVIVNVSPLEYCNFLLVPRRYQCLPQALTEDAIHLALDTVLLSAHSGFILGFNSLCALASVNHQHFHGYYLEHELLIKKATSRRVIGPCYELADWPVRGFIFQVKGHTVQETARSVYKVVCILQQQEIAHNVFITRGDELGDVSQVPEQTVRVVLWPRQSYFGVKADMTGPAVAFNVAMCELAGHLPIFNQESFDAMTEDIAVKCIQRVSLTLQEFEELKDTVIVCFSNERT